MFVLNVNQIVIFYVKYVYCNYNLVFDDIWDDITYPVLKFQWYKRWSLGMDKCFIPNFKMDVVTCTCWK